MAKKHAKLTKPPIIEAIIEFQFTDIELKWDDINKIADHYKTDFPEQKTHNKVNLSFNLGPDAPTSDVNDLGPQFITLQNKNKSKLINIATNRVSYSIIKSYSEWSSFQQIAMQIWGEIKKINPAISCTRIGVRFINELKTPEGSLDFDDILLISPRIPQQIPQCINAFSSTVVVQDQEMKIYGSIKMHFDGKPRSNIYLDIDTFCADESLLLDTSIPATLESLQNYKNDIFFNSVTPIYLKGL